MTPGAAPSRSLRKNFELVNFWPERSFGAVVLPRMLPLLSRIGVFMAWLFGGRRARCGPVDRQRGLFLGLTAAAVCLTAPGLRAQSPVIVTQPVSKTAVAGTAITFDIVVSSSSAVSYQWYRLPVTDPVWQIPLLGDFRFGVSNAATFTINLPNLQMSGDQFRCEVTNGNGSVTSNIVTLVVTAPQLPPTISIQPTSKTVNVGQSTSLSVTASGSPNPTYQWYKGSLAIAGATSPLLNFPVAQLTDSGSYSVEVSNANGSIRSSTATLTVLGSTGTGDTHVFTTFTGASGSPGGGNGNLSVARFNGPNGLAFDSAGNLYIADENNHAIRKISTNGTVTTFAGQAGSAGSNDGTGVNARFLYPKGLAIDTAGNVYVADSFNHIIRKITPAGVVTTLAGLAGTLGATDGLGSAARFNYPIGIAVAADGTVYVADRSSSTIRRISSNGMVSTLAGNPGSVGTSNGTGSAARFTEPTGLTIDAAGNLFVADTFNHTIRKVTPAGVVTTFAGQPGIGGHVDGLGGRLSYPNGLGFDVAGNLFVAQGSNATVRRITADGVISTVAGVPNLHGNTDGLGSVTRFGTPIAVAADITGNLYISDNTDNTIRRGAITTVPQFGSAIPNQTLDVGTTAYFTSAAVGAGPLSYRWQRLAAGSTTWTDLFNGGAYNGVTTATLIVTVSADMNADQFRVIATGPLGTTTSAVATLNVAASVPAPVIANHPSDQTVEVGQPASFTVTATGQGPLGYSWQSVSTSGSVTTLSSVNSADYLGITTSTLQIPSATLAMTGLRYRCVVTNVGGSATSNSALLTVNAAPPPPPPPPSRLTNVSVTAMTGSGGDILTLGLSTSGSGPKNLLIRVAGPALTPYGVPNVLADPRLVLHSSGVQLAQNDDWGNVPAIVAAASQVGAFAFDPNSKDAALLASLNPGGYTVQATAPAGASGNVLIEAYDAEPSNVQVRLSNLSALYQIGAAGRETLILGFTISGNQPKTLLLRGVGPTLKSDLFGISSAIADPRLRLYSGSQLINENDNWGNNTALATAFAQTGAFPYVPNSADAALLVTLAPGGYTIHVSGVNGASGLALAEIYEVP